MPQPIFHKCVTGFSATLIALSTVKIADNIESFLQNTNTRLQQLEHNSNRVTESIERGMNKYAPPPKGVKT